MFKKSGLVLLLVFLVSLGTLVASADTKNIDLANVSDGYVSISYDMNDDVRYKVMVSKDDQKYYYDLLLNNETFSLQFGSGLYKVAIFEQVSGKSYKAVAYEKFEVELADELISFLSSSQTVNFDAEMKTVKLAKELTQDLDTDLEKVNAIYEYIVSSIDYDLSKANNVSTSYVPNVENTILTGTGICYDYASVFAAMTWSIGVPTKLLKGYKVDQTNYHAWNEVYLEGSWVTIDTTYDAAADELEINYDMIKDSRDYNMTKYY